jgi:LmbE family N-acetylglucosaminyl deacetylase
MIFTHRLDDRHQDHRLVAELTWQTFRDHLVLEYEIPKYEGDLGQPNLFVPLGEEFVARKLDMLMSSFPSQSGRSWFSRDVFQAHLRLRGIECNGPSGYAEAFHARKATL